MESKELHRPEVKLVDECDRFKIKKFDFPYQYCHLCFSRLIGLLPFIKESAVLKWDCYIDKHSVDTSDHSEKIEMENEGKVPLVRELKDIRLDIECVIIGLVTKEMKKRPTILDEYLQDIYYSSDKNESEDYISEDDKIYIEDSSSRVPLLIDKALAHRISASELLSGTVIALKGCQIPGGSFLVKDFTFPNVPERILNRESNSLLDQKLPVYIGFVSGINIGSDSENSLSLQLLRDFILGIATYDKEQQFISSRISQLIIAGNSISLLDTAKETNTGTGTKLIVDNEVLSKRLRVFDSFISQLVSSVPVAIMPGEDDPVPISLPQPPFQPYIFKHARKYQSLTSFTNPCSFRINDVRISGISGKTISKLSFYTSYKDPIEALKFCVLSRNLAPACPDIMPCYPFSNHDPFILNYQHNEFPQIVFSGNQEKFDIYKFPNDGPICFTIPNFYSNPCLVLLDINTFETKTITFS